MRSLKLVPALAAAMTLLVLAPAGASARTARAAIHGGACRLHIEAQSAPISAGEETTIYGSLSCPNSEEAGGKQVSIYERSAPALGYTLIGTATTESAPGSLGAFKLTPPVFETNSEFYALSQGARSAHRVIRVSPVVTATTPTTPPENSVLVTGGGGRRRIRHLVTFSGKVTPTTVGAVAVLQREAATANEEWHPISVPVPVVTPAGSHEGTYRIPHIFVVPGDANIRVLIRPRSKMNAAGASTPTSYEISQAENPLLTIETSGDPLAYGQTVNLKGVVKDAASGTPLTLLARARQGVFAPVATGSTGAGGTYEFKGLMPLHSTLYKVSDGTVTSATLFEGVKYALSVAPVPTTVPAGQAVTISGTVLPTLVGHPVYLEHQGSLKLGWTVVDLGAVQAPAQAGEPAPFSIIHTFDTPGTKRLRVMIPGDPGNQGSAAQTFELTVTPTPASALMPEAPGNTRLPSEGQL